MMCWVLVVFTLVVFKPWKASFMFRLYFLAIAVFFFCGLGLQADPMLAVDTQNRLVIFDSASPGSVTIKPLTGVGWIAGLDFRPSNGQLYALALGSNDTPSTIYRINPGTGAATFVTKTSKPILGLDYAIDFDPVTDKLRAVASNYIDAPNLLIDVDTGQVITESPLFYPPAYYPQQEVGLTNISALAHTNNVKNATVSQLYGIDIIKDSLVTLNPPGQPSGTVFINGALGVDTSSLVGFDIQEGSGEAYAILNVNGTGYSQLYRIDLQVHSNNRAQLVGQIGNTNLLIEDFAIRRAQPRTFVVNSAADNGDGVCDAEQCTLREAIGAANAVPTDDAITFNIPNSDPNRDAASGVFTITPQSALPAITDTVTIDGYSQPGASPNTLNQGNNAVLLIEINGVQAGENSNGVVLLAMHSTIRGLVINRFGDAGIRLESDPSAYNIIEGNFIGTDAGGTRALGNKDGILIDANPYNLIGGTAPQSRNLISGNRENGVLTGHFTFGLGTFNNRILGNYIGTDRHGNAAVGNGGGIHFARGSSGIFVGAPGDENVISGNRIGIYINGYSTSNNKVLGNIIGANASGDLPVPNTFYGVRVAEGGSLIGGIEPGEGNQIAYNGLAGVRLDGGQLTMRGNSVYANGRINIDLHDFYEFDHTPTPNDETNLDGDWGPNGLQNYPLITSATYQNGRVVVTGRLKSLPSTKFALDFFDAGVPLGAPDGAGDYQAKKYLNSVEVTTDSDGLALFAMDLGPESGGKVITATATNQQKGSAELGSTSEISPAFYVPPAFRFAVSESRTREDAGQALIRFERSTSEGAASVDFEIFSGTAQPDVDYANYPLGRGTVNFADGEKSALIPLAVINDTLDEPLESINLRLANPGAGYGFYAPAGTRLLIEDDDASPWVSINNISVNEGDGGSTNATFTITLSKTSAQTISVQVTSYNGTARAPADFTNQSARLIFLPGEKTKTFSVPVNGDMLYEPAELFYAVLSSPSNVIINNGRGRAVIADNEEIPRLSIGNVTITEGNAGQRLAVFRLSLSAPSEQAVNVFYTTADSSALRERDYIATAGVVAFNTGSTLAYIRVSIQGDLMSEPSENFFVNIGVRTGAIVQNNQAIGTILDDDRLPSLSIADASVNEGSLGSRDLSFTVSLSKASGRNILVSYATADGTGRSHSDYSSRNGTLAFAPGETTKAFSVPIQGDVVVESDETFYVLLTGPSNASVSRARGTGTILNDDISE